MYHTSLNIDSSQVHSREGNALVFKQMVGHFFCDVIVKSLHWCRRQASDQLVNHSSLKQEVWVEESVSQPDTGTWVSKQMVHSAQIGLQQTVTKSESGGCKLIDDGCIASGVISCGTIFIVTY